MGAGVMAERHITIVGAGLAGALLATLLAQRGWTGSPSPCGPDCPLRVGWLPPADSQPTPSDVTG